MLALNSWFTWLNLQGLELQGALHTLTPTPAILSTYSSYFITNSSYMEKH